jgi:lipopolysaccharide biosynthesis glycosyltransferase
MNEALHIALTFDDHFWAPAYATMRGICVGTARRKDLVFHLLHIGLTAEHRRQLDVITTEFGAELRDYDMAATDHLTRRVEAFPAFVKHRLNAIVYARLFLADTLPQDIERLIYIDSDILVRTPIERLYDIDLQGNVVAAALCPMRFGFQTDRDGAAKPFFRSEEPYFNSGLLLIDMEAYRKVDIVGTIAREVPAEYVSKLYFDQDILNVALRNKWLVLDYRWNLQNPLPYHEPTDPFVVHYTGVNKPWRLRGKTAFKRHYRHVMTNAVFWQFWRERLWKGLKRPFRLLLGGRS